MKVQKWLLFISMLCFINLISGVTVAPNPSVFLGKDNQDLKLHHNVLNPDNMIGSRPPSCENKCFGCMPCEAIQVPTSMGLQSSNYLPEGWKCKCGLTYFTP